MSDKSLIAPRTWKEMKEPMSLEDYAAQRMQAQADTPADLSALGEFPMDTFYAQFDPDRLQDRFRGANHRYTPQALAALEANRAKVAPPGARDEIVSFLVPGPDGLALVQPPGKAFVTRDRHGNIRSRNSETPRPPGARFGAHNHPSDTFGFADHTLSADGYGDSMSLSSPDPYPMTTVARPRSGPLKGQDAIGVHEMVNGQLIFRVPYGAITDDDERALIQQNLNRAQRNFYRE
jgi:hypothetical protein